MYDSRWSRPPSYAFAYSVQERLDLNTTCARTTTTTKERDQMGHQFLHATRQQHARGLTRMNANIGQSLTYRAATRKDSRRGEAGAGSAAAATTHAHDGGRAQARWDALIGHI